MPHTAASAWRGESLSESLECSGSSARATRKQPPILAPSDMASLGILKSVSLKLGSASRPPGSRLYTPSVYLQPPQGISCHVWGLESGINGGSMAFGQPLAET